MSTCTAYTDEAHAHAQADSFRPYPAKCTEDSLEKLNGYAAVAAQDVQGCHSSPIWDCSYEWRRVKQHEKSLVHAATVRIRSQFAIPSHGFRKDSSEISSLIEAVSWVGHMP